MMKMSCFVYQIEEQAIDAETGCPRPDQFWALPDWARPMAEAEARQLVAELANNAEPLEAGELAHSYRIGGFVAGLTVDPHQPGNWHLLPIVMRWRLKPGMRPQEVDEVARGAGFAIVRAFGEPFEYVIVRMAAE